MSWTPDEKREYFREYERKKRQSNPEYYLKKSEREKQKRKESGKLERYLKSLDLTGRVFGRLTVLFKAESINWGTVWACKCECGTEKECAGKLLLSGKTKSCGCLAREKASERWIMHGGTKDREFNIWQSMKQRCYDKNCPHYGNYGGRGITVCDRWMLSYENFLNDMGRCPKGLSLDRVNNDGNYCPENCKWGTVKEQCNNRRSNKFVTCDGETLTYSQWCDKLGLSRWLIDNNKRRKGISPEQTITDFYKSKLLELQQPT